MPLPRPLLRGGLRLSSALAAAAATVPPAPESSLDFLRGWRENSDLGRLNRVGPGDVAPQRRVVVVIGITGAGKSSTSNTLAGRLHKAFAQSASVTSVTQASAFRDYTFLKEDFRVVDTPGLGDTNRKAADVRGELRELAKFAPHGITAFVVVVPRGRFTSEHEAALRELLSVFGERLTKFSVVALTGATDPVSEARSLLSRDAVVDEINGLPLRHFFRRFIEDCALRVVPIENRFDPQRSISRMALHQRILDVETATGGERYDLAGLVGEKAEVADDEGGSGDAEAALGQLETALQRAAPLLRGCSQRVVREAGGRALLRIDCELVRE